ncbi:hypothetical protein K1719_023500 [Acacia pycnantha]|nr:hypothetical protein K1719_023500 [Acacia pycnantha]
MKAQRVKEFIDIYFYNSQRSDQTPDSRVIALTLDHRTTKLASPLSLAYWSNALVLGLSPSPYAAPPSSLPSRLCHIKATNAFASCNSDVCY